MKEKIFTLSDLICILTDIERDHLMELWLKAANTPVLVYNTDPFHDMSTDAWNEVSKYQQELGKRHGYDWEEVVIQSDGKVFKLSEQKT